MPPSTRPALGAWRRCAREGHRCASAFEVAALVIIAPSVATYRLRCSAAAPTPPRESWQQCCWGPSEVAYVLVHASPVSPTERLPPVGDGSVAPQKPATAGMVAHGRRFPPQRQILLFSADDSGKALSRSGFTTSSLDTQKSYACPARATWASMSPDLPSGCVPGRLGQLPVQALRRSVDPGDCDPRDRQVSVACLRRCIRSSEAILLHGSEGLWGQTKETIALPW